MSDNGPPAHGVESLGGAMTNLRVAGEHMLANTQRLQTTLIDQAEHNTTSFFEMMRAAAAAKSVPDTLAVHIDYARAQTTRTFDHMRALAAAVTKAEG